jgi:sugar phosphate isomerase/epimerase
MMGFCTTYETIVKQTSAQAVMQTAADNLRLMSQAASECGATLALENIGRWEPLGDEDTLPQLVELIDDPNTGFCLDTGHAHAFGQCNKKWLKAIGNQLFATHFNDNHARGIKRYPSTGFVDITSDIDEHLPVGFGTIPWLEVVSQLIENDYQGIVSFETKGWPNADPVESLTRAIQWWRACTQLAISKIKPVTSTC